MAAKVSQNQSIGAEVFQHFFVSGTWEDMGLKKDFLVLKQVREYLLDLNWKKNYELFWRMFIFFCDIIKRISPFPGRKNPTGPGIYSFKCRRAENLFNLLQVSISIAKTRFCPSPQLPNSVMSYALKIVYLNYNTDISYNAYDYYFRPVSGVKSQVQSLLMW